MAIYSQKIIMDYLESKIQEKYPYLTAKQVKNVLKTSLLRNLVVNEILEMVDFILQNEFATIK